MIPAVRGKIKNSVLAIVNTKKYLGCFCFNRQRNALIRIVSLPGKKPASIIREYRKKFMVIKFCKSRH